MATIIADLVSMESGLEGRNNVHANTKPTVDFIVSMESGLEGRNQY